MLGLPVASLAIERESPFPLLVPRSFVSRMRRNDPNDPLLRQVMPLAAENLDTAGFTGDPLGEQGLSRNGCIQKYPGRVLLVLTEVCPIHCRYCFRREFPYAGQTALRKDFEPALRTIRDTAGVREVILSGGDPLSLSNDKLERLIRSLDRIETIETLRLHTRFPVVLPSRVDAGLLEVLIESRMQIVVVLHINHPQEIDESVIVAARKLKTTTNFLLNQSVLLKSINDDAETLISLSHSLESAGVLPYYLHLLDRVTGAAHFEVKEPAAIRLVSQIRERLPGYLVPSLVREQKGKLSKTPID